MARERRFRGFTLAHVEHVEAREDGTIAMIGLSGSGDAVAMIVRPEAIDELVSRLQASRRTGPDEVGRDAMANGTLDWSADTLLDLCERIRV